TDFRSKLIQSGFFSMVSVDEQTPSQDRKFTVRITAQWKPASAREHAAVDPTPEELEKKKKRAKEGQFGRPPIGMPPGGMPQGVMPPGATPPPMRVPTPPVSQTPTSPIPRDFSARYGIRSDEQGTTTRPRKAKPE